MSNYCRNNDTVYSNDNNRDNDNGYDNNKSEFWR